MAQMARKGRSPSPLPVRQAGRAPEQDNGRLGEPSLPKKKEYSFDVIETAENLYVYRQKTYEEISRIIDVPVVTIQRWSEKFEWRDKKLAYIKARVGRRRELYVLKDQLIKDAKDNTDPQAVYKLGALQRTIDAEEKGDPPEQGTQKIDRPQVFLDFMRDLVSFLKDRDPAALEGLEKNFDEFVGWAKEKYA